MSEPRFARLDLTPLVEAGVLLAANETFFWPLGLALTWTMDEGEATDLHLRQWQFDDGHLETIVLDDDELERVRHAAFAAWLDARIARLPENERARAGRIRQSLMEAGLI